VLGVGSELEVQPSTNESEEATAVFAEMLENFQHGGLSYSKMPRS
jgi:hypothetical protein